MSQPRVVDEAYDREPEDGVYFGATSHQAELMLRDKYPVSWPRLLEIKVREMQRLLNEVQSLTSEVETDNSYLLKTLFSRFLCRLMHKLGEHH